MAISIGDATSIVTSVIGVGGLVLYLGRSLAKLEQIGKGVETALSKVERHDQDIADLKEDVAIIKTRQEDCGACP